MHNIEGDHKTGRLVDMTTAEPQEQAVTSKASNKVVLVWCILHVDIDNTALTW